MGHMSQETCLQILEAEGLAPKAVLTMAIKLAYQIASKEGRDGSTVAEIREFLMELDSATSFDQMVEAGAGWLSRTLDKGASVVVKNSPAAKALWGEFKAARR